MEDEERGGLESEDKSGTILDEDDIGNISPEDISVDEEPGKHGLGEVAPRSKF